MRGEHSSEYTGEAYRMGSSPHARGARLAIDAGDAGDGIIPACAGSTK